MRGETRTLVGLPTTRRESERGTLFPAANVTPGRGGFSLEKRSAGPNDSSFFLSGRVLSQDARLRNPFRQHAYSHAAIKRVAAAISSAPFRIFQETSSETENSYRQRKLAFKGIQQQFPKLKTDVFDLFHDKGEKSRRILAREFATMIRKIAPSANMGAIAKAVGLDLIEEGSWFDLFSNVNPTMTRSQLWEASVIFLQTDGESFWVMFDEDGSFWEPPSEPVVNPREQQAVIPAEIMPFGKSGWSEVVDKESKMLDGWIWRDPRKGFMNLTGGKPIPFTVEQIVHLRFIDPENMFRGLSPFTALDIDIKTDFNAARYNNAFFEKGAQLSGWLMSDDGMTAGQRQNLEEQFDRDHVGIDNMWRPGVFESGKAKWVPTGVTQRDMQFFTLREWARDSVLSVIGTPKSEMGIFQDVNRASAMVSKRVFWENTNLPIIHYIEDLLFSDLFVPVSGGGVFGLFDVSNVEALREDLTEKVEAAKALFAMGVPLNDINERLELGFEPYAWGDVAWLNQNLVAVSGDPTVLPKPAPTPTPGPGEEPPEDDDETPPDEDEPGGDGDGDDGESPEEEPPEDGEGEGDEENTRPGPSTSRPPAALTFLGEYDTPEKREQRHEEILVRVMKPGERAIKKIMRGLVARMRAASLAAVGEADLGSITNVEQILFNETKFQVELSTKVRPVFEDILIAAAEEAEEELVEIGILKLENWNPIGRQVGGQFDFEAAAIISSQAARIERVVSTVRGILSESLDQGLATGVGKAGLQGIIRGKFKTFSGSSYLNRIAVTESSLGTNTARDLVFRRRQVPSNIWSTAGDDRVRPDHIALDDGVPRAIGFNFGKLLGGIGIVLEFPLDPRAPADLTILCRCALLPSQETPRESPNRFHNLNDQQLINLPPDAYPKLRPNAKETLDMFSHGGNFTPERRLLHDAIVRRHFVGKTVVKRPITTILGGGPSSGKSVVSKAAGVPANTVVINADEIRQMLPEWKPGLLAKDPLIAKWTHEEASLIGKRIAREARGFDILLDGTGDSSFQSLTDKIAGFRNNGSTKVIGQYVTIDTDEAMRRMKARGDKPTGPNAGRYVPEPMLRGTHESISTTFPQAIEKGLFDELTLWDNNGGPGGAFIIGKGGGTTFDILNEDAWLRFLNKAKP